MSLFLKNIIIEKIKLVKRNKANGNQEGGSNYTNDVCYNYMRDVKLLFIVI